MTQQFMAPLVGMRFRPPALTIIQGLGQDQPLVLHREPENSFDENAVAVYMPPDWSEQLPDLFQEASAEAQSLGTPLNPTLTHLGYIARDYAKRWAPLLDQGQPPEAKLIFSLAGSPVVSWGEGELEETT